MKIREIVMVIAGTLAVLAFVIFMFDYYIRSEEVQVIKKHIYFDTLILQEQTELKKKDSVLLQHIKNRDEQYKKTLQYHDYQIKKIHEEIKKLNNK